MTRPDTPHFQLPAPPGPIDREVGMIVLQESATQVGICLTGIGLIRLIGQNGVIGRAADDVLFLLCLTPMAIVGLLPAYEML